ncbi:MAG: undecaprenyldiphospho-muramoylpentapeptide beta-N-acetylglucosaminyltransferase [Balneolaceae bacterium]|nr:MAG: undecaprenyldiphospho-muramoylpentapeptide beta-N-acetylglucosaminyltransferase [Balneolaceae bacterium]
MNRSQKNISSTDTLTAAGNPLRILLAAGGTGGHVYPAISIADAIREQEPLTEFLFAGTKTRMEWDAVPRYGYEIQPVWISGFHRQFTPKNLLFPLKLITSLIQSYFMIRSFRPDIVIACGGFVSGPVGWVAAKSGYPLVLQEQNSFPGITTRLLADLAVRIFTAFEDADQYLPGKKTVVTGNPVRKRNTTATEDFDPLDLSRKLKTVLILGGSGGARALNEVILTKLETLHNDLNLQIVWQCGDKYYDDLIQRFNPADYPNLRITAYLQNMHAAYERSDLVITRAGAGTCSELMNLGQPAILVPSPNVAGDHQTKNASSLERAGAAILLREEEMESTLTSLIREIISDREKLQSMQLAMIKLAKPDAAEIIAGEVITIARNSRK